MVNYTDNPYYDPFQGQAYTPRTGRGSQGVSGKQLGILGGATVGGAGLVALAASQLGKSAARSVAGSVASSPLAPQLALGPGAPPVGMGYPSSFGMYPPPGQAIPMGTRAPLGTLFTGKAGPRLPRGIDPADLLRRGLITPDEAVALKAGNRGATASGAPRAFLGVADDVVAPVTREAAEAALAQQMTGMRGGVVGSVSRAADRGVGKVKGVAAAEGGTAKLAAALGVEDTGKMALGKAAFKKVGRGALAGIAAEMAVEPLEGLSDKVDSSGAFGDVGAGALRGAALGSIGGPWGAAGGALVGGGIGFFTGDRNAAENVSDAVMADMADTRFQYGLNVQDGDLDPRDLQAAEQRYQQWIEHGEDPGRAFVKAFAPIDEALAFKASPEGQLMEQLDAARQEQRRQAEVATKYAAQHMAPLQASTMKMFQNLQGIRDLRIQDPNLPADARAIFQASAPIMDQANLAVLNSASPMAALMEAYPDYYAPQSDLPDQLMQMYMLQKQYSGQGGADNFAAMAQDAALAGE